MVKIETSFYEHYRRYYQCIIEKAPSPPCWKKESMAGMSSQHPQMFIIQGGITALCVVFAPEVITVCGLSPTQVPLLRISCIGSFLQALMSLTVTILFYFDLRQRVLSVAFCYFILNAGLTQLSLWLGFRSIASATRLLLLAHARLLPSGAHGAGSGVHHLCPATHLDRSPHDAEHH
jgi:uncharacterized membrane protein